MAFVTAKQKRVTAKESRLTVLGKRSSVVIEPKDLHTVLEPTRTEIMFFPEEKKMRSYRKMLYSVSAQGEYSYRTLRNPEDHRELIVWRMK